MTNDSDTGISTKINCVVYELVLRLCEVVANCNGVGENEPCRLLQVLTTVVDQFGDGKNVTKIISQKQGVETGFQKPLPPVRGRACAGACTPAYTVYAPAHAPACTRVARTKKPRRLIPLPQNSSEEKIAPRKLLPVATVSKHRNIVKSKPESIAEKLIYELPPSVKPVWDYWVAQDLRVPNPNTKIFKQDILAVQKVLRGTFFRTFDPTKNRKFTYGEIRQAIARFAQAATNPDYEPANKNHLRKLTLSGFFWSAYAKRYKSYFLLFTEEKPKLMRGQAEPLEDLNPTLTEALVRKHYRTPPDDLTQHTRNQFITGAAKLRHFYDKIYLRNVSLSPEPIGQIIDYMCECLAKTFGHANVKPANYASDWTFKQALPEYLSEIAAWDIGLEGE